MTEPLIVAVIRSYYPDWEPPRGRAEWLSCLCPFHGDSRPSASVSFENEAFACHACGEKGDALAILMRKEEIGYLEALEVAEGLSPGCNDKIRREPAGKPRRRAFGSPGSDGVSTRKDGEVPSRVRGRSSPWA